MGTKYTLSDKQYTFLRDKLVPFIDTLDIPIPCQISLKNGSYSTEIFTKSRAHKLVDKVINSKVYNKFEQECLNQFIDEYKRPKPTLNTPF